MRTINQNEKCDTSDDLVSIVIPLYNNERFISKCLSSLCSQTYQNIEILVMDNSSTDSSFSIAQTYANADNRVKCFTLTSKGGVSAARNAGIEVAQGKYLCFIDSDDYVSPTFVEALLTIVKENGADVGCVKSKTVSEKQNKTFKTFNPQKYDIKTYNKVEGMNELFSGRPIRMNIWNKIYPMHLFKGENGIKFKEDIYHGEDLAFLYDVFLRIDKTVFLPQKHYAYTKRRGSLVRSKMNERKLTYLDSAKYAEDKCKSELPLSHAHVAGWRASVNIEVTYYMWRDRYFDKERFEEIQNTFRENLPYFRKGKRQYGYRKLFVPTVAKLFVKLYKIRFKKELKNK